MKNIGLVAVMALSLATATMHGCKGCTNQKQEGTLEQRAQEQVNQEQDASNSITFEDTNTSDDAYITTQTLDSLMYNTGADSTNSITPEATPNVSNAMFRYNDLVSAGNDPQEVGRVVCEYILAEYPKEKRLILSGKTARATAEQLFDKIIDPVEDNNTKQSFVDTMYALGLQGPSYLLPEKATIVVNYRCEGGELLLK